MTPAILFRPACLLLALVALAACASTGSVAGPSPGKTSRVDSQSPVRDLDVLPRELPPLLVEALRYPYTPPSPANCTTIAAGVLELDLLLGEDLDSPARPPANDHTAGRLLVSGIKSSIPYFGWLRRLTGADRRQRLAQAAYIAGHARRGYLKGLGASLGCSSPAAPVVPAESLPG